MYKNSFSLHYDFWEQPTQAYSNEFGISNDYNFHEIFKDFLISSTLFYESFLSLGIFNCKGFLSLFFYVTRSAFICQ